MLPLFIALTCCFVSGMLLMWGCACSEDMTPAHSATETLTPRASATPEPSATSTRTAQPSPSETYSATPSCTRESSPHATPTCTESPTGTPTLSPLPSKPCEAPWPYTYAERQTIAAAARNHLWLGPAGDEPMTLPQEDAILSIGLYLLDLGAPLTSEYAVLAENHAHIRCRGFALGIVALVDGREYSADNTCRNWAVLSWGGDPLNTEGR